MSLATQKLKEQKRAYLSQLWKGLALAGIGGYCGVMVLRGGIGNAPANERSGGALLYKGLTMLTEKFANAERLAPIVLACIFGIIAAIGIYHLLRGAWQMTSSHTMLGKSMLQQAKSHERFADVLESIDADMEHEPLTFGKLAIGREWILAAEAMRLSRIRGVFWMDAGMEDYVLCCVDEAKNVWAEGLRYQDERNDAMAYLQKTLPDIVTGDKEACMAFVRGSQLSAQPEEPETADASGQTADEDFAKLLAIPSGMTYSFAGAGGVPTSNFTCEEVRDAFRSLDISHSITLRMLSPCAAESVSFDRKSDQEWEVGIRYKRRRKDCHTAKTMSRAESEDILVELMNAMQR